jgi:16S rRNA processing protein RimM
LSPERLQIARVGRAHGLRGEVHVWPITDREERFAPGARAFLRQREMVIAAVRPMDGHWLIRFEGVDDRNAAEALNGGVLEAEPLGPLPEGEYWVHELIGRRVRDQHGREHGRVEAVQDNPAHALLVLESGALVPMVFVRTTQDDVIDVDVPEGLFEVIDDAN